MTVVALALGVVVVLAGLAVFDVGLLVAARARVQTAADLAALAALTATGEPAAASAAGVAEANGAELRGCGCSAGEAVVTVRRRVVLPPTGLPVVLTARARAVLPGPPARVPAGWPRRRPDEQRAGPGPGPARSASWTSPGGSGTARAHGAASVEQAKAEGQGQPAGWGAAGGARGGAERHDAPKYQPASIPTKRLVTNCSHTRPQMVPPGLRLGRVVPSGPAQPGSV